MSGSTGENGLWLGFLDQKPAPTAAIPLSRRVSKRTSAELLWELGGWGGGTHMMTIQSTTYESSSRFEVRASGTMAAG